MPQVRERVPPKVYRQTRALLHEFADPERFVTRVFGEAYYAKQAEFMRAVRRSPRVSVVGANGTGKDWTVGRIIPWWLVNLRPSIVVIIGPTHRQVHDIVWMEVRAAAAAADKRGYALGGATLKTPKWEIGERHFAVGFATIDALNIQGYHSENLLVVVTEAHNVPESHFEAIDRLNPRRLVLTGNPFSTEGRFHASHHGNRDRWHTIAISAADTPNYQQGRTILPGLVTREAAENIRAEYGEDHPLYRAGVLCEWATSLDDTLISLTWVMAAVDRDLCRACVQPDSEKHECESPAPRPVLGVDVARFGSDRTVLARRDGPAVSFVAKLSGNDTQEVAGKVARYCADHPDLGTVIVDEVGVGGGVVDRLRETGTGTWRLLAFNGGEAARDPSRYVNRVAEAWYAMRESFRLGKISIPRDQALIGQLTSRRFLIQGDARIKLEPKEEMRREGRKSPDEADALAMTFSTGAAYVPALVVKRSAWDEAQAPMPRDAEPSRDKVSAWER